MSEVTSELQKEIKKGKDLSIIRIFDLLVSAAYEIGASDIHIDPYLSGLSVRLRVDGILERNCILPPGIREELIARTKVVSGLRTDIRLLPQDGRVRMQTEWMKSPVDLRVSILPTQFGENVVARLLVKNRTTQTLDDLGFVSPQVATLHDACAKPQGLILVVGPTGSGKTTTLYSLLQLIDRESLSVVTIEDPIEYSIHDVRQIQTNSTLGFSFATALRAILRQDPGRVSPKFFDRTWRR